MIKQTFYNLPKEKRERIIWAIRLEFSRSPAERISINRIVQEANISRGSFYQYFDDKVDLVQIITEDFIGFITEATAKTLNRTNGDIFAIPLDLLDSIIDFAEREDNKRILKRIIENFKLNSDLIADYLKNRHISSGDPDVLTRINTDMLKSDDEEYVHNLYAVLMTLLFKALFDIFACGKEPSEVKGYINRVVEILKWGAIKEGTEERRMQLV